MTVLKGTRPIVPPLPARNMDAESAPPVAWSDYLDGMVRGVFRRLKFGDSRIGYRGWQFVSAPDRVWGDAERLDVSSIFGHKGGWAYRGNCNAFAPKLREHLRPYIPDHAMRLVICKTGDGRDHMVLALNTDRGALICCNIQGCWPDDAPAFKGYKWLYGESGGRAWDALKDAPAPRKATLADLMEGTESE